MIVNINFIFVLFFIIVPGTSFLFNQNDPEFDTSLMHEIFFQPWPRIKSPSSGQQEIVASCFQELPFNALDHTIILHARHHLRRIGCPLRIPSHSLVEIKEMKLRDDIGYVQIYSGDDFYRLRHTSGKLYGAEGFTFGPFEDTYVFILFKPTSKDDSITFNLIGTFILG